MIDTAIETAPSPEEIVAGIEGRGRLVRTAFGEGFVAWRVWGEGPPLVLLHGGHGSWTHWIRNVGPPAGHFTIIAPDIPGYGDSDVPSGPIDLERLAEILASGLADVVPRNEPVALAGFSFGGVVAGHVAAVSGHPVKRLVLVGSGGLNLPRPPPPRLVKWQMEETESGRRAAHRVNLAAAMIADPHKIDDLAIHLQAENTRRARLRSRSLSLSDTLLRRLEQARPPLAGIWGGQDAMTGAYIETRRELLARLDPGSPFAIIPGAGHWAPYEAAETVNETLVNWLR